MHNFSLMAECYDIHASFLVFLVCVLATDKGFFYSHFQLISPFCIWCLCSRHSKIVLVATQDSASKHISPAIEALKRLGATDPLQGNYRDSFAFAGYAGVNKPQWITQKRADRYLGPSEIFPQIPLSINQ